MSLQGTKSLSYFLLYHRRFLDLWARMTHDQSNGEVNVWDRRLGLLLKVEGKPTRTQPVQQAMPSFVGWSQGVQGNWTQGGKKFLRSLSAHCIQRLFCPNVPPTLIQQSLNLWHRPQSGILHVQVACLGTVFVKRWAQGMRQKCPRHTA